MIRRRQSIDVVRLCEGVAAHLAHELEALDRVDGTTLLFVHRVNLGLSFISSSSCAFS
jgi:hypothetical protein